MPIDSIHIDVSGQPTFSQSKIDFPSGIFKIPLNAHLSAVNASFGFNNTPHRFDLEYISDKFSSEVLPPIGSGVQFTIGDSFLIQGRINHADFQKSPNGNIIRVSIEDIRLDIDDIYIDTFGIFGSADTPVQNVVDVRYWYLINFIKTNGVGRNRAVKDLKLLEEHGATYRQIYEATKYFEEQVGTINDIISKLPDPEIIEAQLPFDPDAYRWQFRSQPFLDALSRILNDVSYDFYWNMQDKKINVINRKFVVNIDKDNIPVAGDTSPITTLRYGNDEGERPTSIAILGAQMEGLIGRGTLKTQSGAYEIDPSGTLGHDIYELGIDPFASGPFLSDPGGLSEGIINISAFPVFKPGWRGSKIKYFTADGRIANDFPTDREIRAALKGIEYWAMEKKLENRIDVATIEADRGTTQNQPNVISASGLGLMDNRGAPGDSWVIEWYNRVRNFAQNHFARTYILDEGTSLFSELDEIEIVEAAWCNIENLTDSKTFEDNYKIKNKYNPLQPFWDAENNKMRAWASFRIRSGFDNITGRSFVKTPKWGPDGKGSPGQYAEYNEVDDTQYVPIEVRKWDNAEDAFEEKFLDFIHSRERGLMIRLPNICWAEFDPSQEDSSYSSKPILRAFGEAFKGKTQHDIHVDPLKVGRVFERISNIAIPVRVKRRYGYKWPFPWASGTGTTFELQIRDDLAPWSFEPRGVSKSWELMNEEAKSSLSSRVSTRNFVTFAEVEKLGLPLISFDNFADQSFSNSVYGLVSHGVTSLSVRKSSNWWQTKYSVKSHFPQFIKARPIRDRIEEQFEFIAKRLERKIPPRRTRAFQPPQLFEPQTNDGRAIFEKRSKDTVNLPVTITQVRGRVSGDEHYVSIDDNGNIWPAAFRFSSLDTSSNIFNQRKARAVDGFLEVGMRSVYHYEEQEDGSFVHYFTGGVSLSDGRIVELISSPTLIEGIWRANIQTLPETVTDVEGNSVSVDSISLLNVPFLNQQSVDTTLQGRTTDDSGNTVEGDKMFMASAGHNNRILPNEDISTGDNKDKVHLVNVSVPGNVGFGVVTRRPNSETGLGGGIQTITAAGGQEINDTDTIAGTTFNVRFIGAEFDQIAIGDVVMTKQENEVDAAGEARLFCLVVKPLFSPGSAFGPGSFLA